MHPAHDARNDDNNATVIDRSAGRYDVTWGTGRCDFIRTAG
jgi:hypothetical protein